MNAPEELVLAALETSGCSPRPTAGGWSFRCPRPDHSHGDRKPSGRMGVGSDGRVLLWCGRGHRAEEIVGALGLEIGALFPEDTSSKTKRRPNLHAITGGRAPRATSPPRDPRPGRPELGERGIVAVYDYVSADGDVIYRVGRTADKEFPTAHLDAELGWIWGHPPDAARVLFNLPAVLDTVARGGRVFVVEGEKDALNMNAAFPDRLDYVATSKMGGARSPWLPQYTEALRGASVWIVADRDADGTYAAALAARALYGVAHELVIVEARSGGKDASDHLDGGFGLSDFVIVAADRPVAVPA
jgi:hypothetical protein